MVDSAIPGRYIPIVLKDDNSIIFIKKRIQLKCGFMMIPVRFSMKKCTIFGIIGSLVLMLIVSGCVNSTSKNSPSQEPIVGTWEHNDKDTYIWASITGDNQVRIVLYSKANPQVNEESVTAIRKIGLNHYRFYKENIEGLDVTYLPERDVWYAGSNPEYLYYRTIAKQPIPPTAATS